MPLPSATQLARMRGQADAHAATAATLHTLTETPNAFGASESYGSGTAVSVQMQRKLIRTQLADGGFISFWEQHAVCPATTAVTKGQFLKVADLYYEITEINTVDDNLLIQKDLTLKRVTV